MLIDWFTVVAQILNFLILVALLKHFLYDRIIQAMDERNEKIRARLEEVEKKKREAAEEKESYVRKNQEIEEREKELLSEAKQKADVRQGELMAQAKEDVEALRKRWKASVQKEKDAFLRDLRHTVGQKVYSLARRALKDLARESIEEKAAEVFLDKIQGIKKEEQDRILDGIRKSNNRLIVRTSFEAPSRLRHQITRSLHEKFTKELDIDYETKPEMIFGIELKLHGQKVAWNLEDYLETLEEQMTESLESYTQEEETREHGAQAERQREG